MRMSCNGCRVLRKGCSDDCAIRPCLQWIRSPDAQGNATVFLAKFYGRAGLINLITAGPEHVRPAIFRSLLYEACGRMLNPVYGSVGLLWSGNWQLCQAAVESVLRGLPIAQPPPAATAVPPLRSCDIRHVSRTREAASAGHGHGHGGATMDAGGQLHRMANSSRVQFKRSGGAAHSHRSSAAAGSSYSGIELVFSQPAAASSTMVDIRQAQPLNWAPYQPPTSHHEYDSASHDDEDAVRESDSNGGSVDTVDVSHVSQSEPEPQQQQLQQPREGDDDERADGLDLTLGLPPRAHKIEPSSDVDDDQAAACHRGGGGEPMKLGLAAMGADSRAR